MSCSKIENKYVNEKKKALTAFSYNRDPFIKWAIPKILLYAYTMSSSDFYRLLVQDSFINNNYVKCVKCQEPMKLNNCKACPEGLLWECKKGKFDPLNPLEPKICGTSKSVRTNSWFNHSKLTPQEIMIITCNWWNKVISFNKKKKKKKILFFVTIDAVMDNAEQIGGKDIVVEIDESKFGKSEF